MSVATKLIIIAGVMLWCAAIAALIFLSGLAIPIIILLMILYSWVAYVFVRYRHARQDELLNVIRASIEAKLPLTPGLRAYLQDRPNTLPYRFSVGVLLHMMVAPYYWAWHRQHSFDRRIAELVDRLNEGSKLSEALAALPALASQETRVAVALGEAKGRIGEFLRRADRERTAGAWMEILPRLFYPVLLLMVVVGIVSFFMYNIVPRFKRIFEDFKMPLPTVTLYTIQFWMVITDYSLLVLLVMVAVGGTLTTMILSRNARWYFPIIGRFYRWDLRALALRSLGTLIEFETPAPEALALMQDIAGFPEPLRKQLSTAQRLVTSGEPLPAALKKAGLLGRSTFGFIESSERTNTLGWALRELGEQQAGRALQIGRRLASLFVPSMVIVMGVLIGFVVYGMFVPLIRIIEGLC